MRDQTVSLRSRWPANTRTHRAICSHRKLLQVDDHPPIDCLQHISDTDLPAVRRRALLQHTRHDDLVAVVYAAAKSQHSRPRLCHRRAASDTQVLDVETTTWQRLCLRGCST